MPEEESLRQLARSPAPFSVWLGIVVLFALFGVIVLATIGPAPRSNTYEEKRARKRLDNFKTLREEDAKALTTYAWVDKGKGVARIPIDRAMDLTIAQLAQTKPVPAGPVASPPPQQSPAAAASPAASPARALSPAASATPKPKAVEGVESATRGQPAAGVKPAPAQPSTQPGATATPAAPAVPAATATPSSAATPSPPAPGSPLPIRGKTPP
jgi:hypothetical protein